MIRRGNKAVERHKVMVDDPRRTKPLLTAIAKAVRPGDLVLDIGTGLGILAIAAAKAGAGHVWAIDVDKKALDVARRSAKKEGVSNKITFIEGLSFDIELIRTGLTNAGTRRGDATGGPPMTHRTKWCQAPLFLVPGSILVRASAGVRSGRTPAGGVYETSSNSVGVDLIICETIGSYAFDENILATLADAKKRFLKKGGKIIPERVELWGAPISRIPRLKMPAGIGVVKKTDLLSKPARLVEVTFKAKFHTSAHVKTRFKLPLPLGRGKGRGGASIGSSPSPLSSPQGGEESIEAKAIAVWPKIHWWKDIVTDASPLAPPTHWEQGILELMPKLEPGTQKQSLAPILAPALNFELIIRPHPDDPKKKTELLWRS